MADLQARLDAVFGALKPTAAPDMDPQPEAWKPSRTQVFRGAADLSGPAAGNDSSDEEYEERQRREALPGLAQALAAEDEADEEGFRPSAAFCRALDREADYDEVDEAAVGLWARQRGEAEGGARPPAGTEVLEGNPWEQRCAQAEALGRPMPSPQQLALGVQAAGGVQLQLQLGQRGQLEPAAMETDGGPAAAAAPAQQQSPRSALASRPRGEGTIKKRVSFTGIPEPPQPWVPPHRRPGFVPRDPSAAGAAAGTGAGQPSRVPDHVRHPERYTCYTLDQPIIVGGSAGQLAEGDEAAELASAAAAAAAAAQHQPGGGGGAETELDADRWQGAVGGGIEFRARQQEAASRQPRQASAGAAGPARGSLAVGAQLAADEVATEQQQTEEEQAGKALLQQDRQQAGQRRQRSLRNKTAAAMEDD